MENFIRIEAISSSRKVLLTAVLPQGELPSDKLSRLRSDEFGFECTATFDPLLKRTVITHTSHSADECYLSHVIGAFALALMHTGIIDDPYVCPAPSL